MILSIPSTSDGRIKDIIEIESCIRNCKELPDYWNWILVEEVTLREMKKDLDAYKITHTNLLDAQSDIERITIKNNMLNTVVVEQTDKINKLENPPWYLDPLFWGPVGFISGCVLTTAIVFAVR